jgi:hypothetical protein
MRKLVEKGEEKNRSLYNKTFTEVFYADVGV